MDTNVMLLEEAISVFDQLVATTDAKSAQAEALYRYDKEHRVWYLVTRELHDLWPEYVHHAIYKAANKLGVFGDYIPTVVSLDNKLYELSGFRVFWCEGVINFTVLAYAYSQGYFPTTLWIRDMDHLKYIESPDMVHERVGHLTALAIPAYANAVKEFGSIALRYLHDEEVIKAFDKIHWWAVEFPLVKTDAGIKVVGPGILSSPGEMVHAICATHHKDTGEKIERVLVTRSNAYSVLESIALGPKQNISVYQTKYLVFENFEVFHYTMTKALVFIAEWIKKEKIKVPY